jgi:archaellum component FlaC
MLEDNKVAKLFLSAIIGEEILELDYIQNEVTRENIDEKVTGPIIFIDEEKKPLKISRFDFAAKIKTETGFKTVTIELQRARYLSDLMRFRRYLGINYQREANSYRDDDDNMHPRQIYCIFFLGYETTLPPRPVLKVDYNVKDASSGEELYTEDEFVAGLHHISWIIQIGHLKERRRNELEQILSVFDQSNILDNQQLLYVDDEAYPEAYQVIIRRLRKAMEDYDLRRKMELEDDVLNAFQKQAREMERLKKTVADNAKTIADKDQAISTLSSQYETVSQELAELKRKYGID